MRIFAGCLFTVWFACAFSSTFANGRIAVAPSNSSIVYAGWVNNTFGTCNNACIFYSNDGGVTFLKKYGFLLTMENIFLAQNLEPKNKILMVSNRSKTNDNHTNFNQLQSSVIHTCKYNNIKCIYFTMLRLSCTATG